MSVMNVVLKKVKTDYTQDEVYQMVKSSVESVGLMIEKEDLQKDGSLVLIINLERGSK